jgi:hypothetical protein
VRPGASVLVRAADAPAGRVKGAGAAASGARTAP